MDDLIFKIASLYQKAATELPADIILALNNALKKETDKNAQEILANILLNLAKAKKQKKLICQDTGTPYFYVEYNPKKYNQKELVKIISKATKIATKQIPLRANAVDILSEKTLGNIPVIYFKENKNLKIELLLKGGGSENISAIYTLPNQNLKADRTLDGIRKCILDAVFQAQGKGCPPYLIGVGIGGNLAKTAELAKKQLFKKIDSKNKNLILKNLEEKTLAQINSLEIGPMGLGGKTTALSLKIAAAPRHPASYFVAISFGCWAMRKQSLSFPRKRESRV